jgi:uncharacterized membrane protein YcjF (UPF0283 family)
MPLIKDITVILIVLAVTAMVSQIVQDIFPMPGWLFGILNAIIFLLIIKLIVDPLFYK